MGRLKLVVRLESLRLGLREGIRKAASIGFKGFQADATRGELSPTNLSATGRRDFLHFIKTYKIQLSSLCGEFAPGFTNVNELDEIIEKTKSIINLAVDLKTNIVTTAIGTVPGDEKAKQWRIMSAALNEVGKYAEDYECSLATETGNEDPQLLKRFLNQLTNRGVKINYDPSKLALNCFDPIKGVYDLQEYIVQVRAKNERRTDEGKLIETPLDEGSVPFKDFVYALFEVGYNGFYIIERERGTNPISFIVKAKEFLERL
ncbi:MAG TPA: sugar phosphate isomerase/epimerase family protein [Candidatus Brocadiia bacterium]|nr:sugar phosphate isomerase/epimerase family protein [Candidatus Brocadiales bacterium]